MYKQYIYISTSAMRYLIFYVVIYILDMTPCKSFLLAKNRSPKFKQLALVTFSFSLLEYI